MCLTILVLLVRVPSFCSSIKSFFKSAQLQVVVMLVIRSRRRDRESDRSVVVYLKRFESTPYPHLGKAAELRQDYPHAVHSSACNVNVERVETCTNHTYIIVPDQSTMCLPAAAHA